MLEHALVHCNLIAVVNADSSFPSLGTPTRVMTTDRVVRPFDWGLDWIPVDGHGDAAPGTRVHAWVDELMRDTNAFFDDPPTRAYQFNPAAPHAAAKGEAGTLRFRAHS
jgi:hypothetical protein